MNNRVVKLLGICFFIGGCCTFSPTSKKCTCKEIYQEVKYHLNENVDTTQEFAKKFIKNENPYLENEIIDKIRFYFNDNKECWIGEEKQLIVDLLGEPDSYLTKQRGKFAKTLSYKFLIERQIGEVIKKPTSSLSVSIFYQESLKEKITRIGANYHSIMVE